MIKVTVTSLCLGLIAYVLYPVSDKIWHSPYFWLHVFTLSLLTTTTLIGAVTAAQTMAGIPVKVRKDR